MAYAARCVFRGRTSSLPSPHGLPFTPTPSPSLRKPIFSPKHKAENHEKSHGSPSPTLLFAQDKEPLPQSQPPRSRIFWRSKHKKGRKHWDTRNIICKFAA